MIISVGHRVKSKQGTQFRILANGILTRIFSQSLRRKREKISAKRTGSSTPEKWNSDSKSRFEEKANENEWLSIFAKGLQLLDDYDHEELDSKGLTKKQALYPTMGDYQELINQMVVNFDSQVFGKEKDQNFQRSIAQIEKGFGENDFYTKLEEKASML